MRQELEGLIGLYEAGGMSRRNFAEGVLALCIATAVSSKAGAQAVAQPIVRARTINHISITTADVGRSSAFYERLTGMPIRDQGPDFCEFRLERGFLGLYAREPGQQLGINHFCFGIDDYEPQSLVKKIEQAIPSAKPFIDYGDQVYVHDPDGAKVQFADVNYKR